MKTSFLDYYKLILDKVSFQPELFAKEYCKAIKVLVDSDQKELNRWLRDRGSIPEHLGWHNHQFNQVSDPITNN